MGYRPSPKRRAVIPKPGSEKGRLLGVSNLEDKIVEESVKRVLEPLWEPLFLDLSYGYRPKRSPKQCVDLLGRTIQQRPVNHVVEADIRGYFDNVNHEWLIKFIQQRVGDPRVIRLLRRMLKSGIMEDGVVRATESGTPQGSIVSPLLSNIYLHYVLDLWFDRRVKPRVEGGCSLLRFADDFVACFQDEEDADHFKENLRDRLEGFNLRLAEEKTRVLEFGRNARPRAQRRGEKPGEFSFLGFTFYCGKTRRGVFKVKRKTKRKKLTAALRRFSEWIRKSRHRYKTGRLIRIARVRVQGHLNYYAITDNAWCCQLFLKEATQILFKWLNRRSQKKSYHWDGFNQVLKRIDWPIYRVQSNLCPFRKSRKGVS